MHDIEVSHGNILGRSVGLDLTLDDFQKVSDEVPFLADLKPSGKYVMNRMEPELDGLGYHEQYSSPPSSSTKWPNFFFLIKISMSTGQGGLKKHGTRAHQARVPEIVVDSYIVRKQCFWAKYFQN